MRVDYQCVTAVHLYVYMDQYDLQCGVGGA